MPVVVDVLAGRIDLVRVCNHRLIPELVCVCQPLDWFGTTGHIKGMLGKLGPTQYAELASYLSASGFRVVHFERLKGGKLHQRRIRVPHKRPDKGPIHWPFLLSVAVHLVWLASLAS